MRRHAAAAAALACLAASSCATQAPTRWTELADALVERMALAPGERVLLVGGSGSFDSLLTPLRQAIVRAGGVDLGAMDRRAAPLGAEVTAFVRGAGGLERADLVEYLRDVDVGVMLPGAVPPDPPYAAMQDVLRSERGRTIHFHWTGAYDLAGRELPATGVVDTVYRNAVVRTDYARLAASQRSFEDALRGTRVRVTSPLGTDLTFEIGDRPVTKQDGDASASRAAAARNLIDREIEIPAGAVRVAPVERSVNGTIAFPPMHWGGTLVEGLVLTFRQGRVVAEDATSGLDAVRAELDAAGDAGRSFREFALGMNPTLAIPADGSPWIPYYGYGSGVVRLSLGDNTELGGAVGGGYVRWNFFTDATVTVGDDVWVRDGRLVRE